MLGMPIDEDVATSIVAQLLFLQHSDPERDIWFYINSPGGSVRDGLAIYDTMQLIEPDVATTCVGVAASAAAVLLGGGAKGKRAVLPNSRVMIHQAHGGVQGYAADIEIHARDMFMLRDRLDELLACHTGKTKEEVHKDTERDRILSATEAVEYGLVDRVMSRRKELPGPGGLVR